MSQTSRKFRDFEMDTLSLSVETDSDGVELLSASLMEATSGV